MLYASSNDGCCWRTPRNTPRDTAATPSQHLRLLTGTLKARGRDLPVLWRCRDASSAWAGAQRSGLAARTRVQRLGGPVEQREGDHDERERDRERPRLPTALPTPPRRLPAQRQPELHRVRHVPQLNEQPCRVRRQLRRRLVEQVAGFAVHAPSLEDQSGHVGFLLTHRRHCARHAPRAGVRPLQLARVPIAHLAKQQAIARGPCARE